MRIAIWFYFGLCQIIAIVVGVCARAGYDDRCDDCQPVPPPQRSESDRLWQEALVQKTVIVGFSANPI